MAKTMANGHAEWENGRALWLAEQTRLNREAELKNANVMTDEVALQITEHCARHNPITPEQMRTWIREMAKRNERVMCVGRGFQPVLPIIEAMNVASRGLVRPLTLQDVRAWNNAHELTIPASGIGAQFDDMEFFLIMGRGGNCMQWYVHTYLRFKDARAECARQDLASRAFQWTAMAAMGLFAAWRFMF